MPSNRQFAPSSRFHLHDLSDTARAKQMASWQQSRLSTICVLFAADWGLSRTRVHRGANHVPFVVPQ